MAKHRKGQQAHRTSPGARRSKPRHAASPWTWLMTGMLLGIIGITAIFLLVTGKWPLNKFNTNPLIRPSNHLASNTLTPKNASKPKSKPKSTESRHTKTIAVAQKKEPARFEFYQLLPNMEVPLPEAPTETTRQTTLNHPIPESSKTVKTEKRLAAAQYLIQAGNFRWLANAEALKNRLHLQGLSAKIQKIEINDGVWFRVTLGPFASEAIALNQQRHLAKQKIASTLILQRQ